MVLGAFLFTLRAGVVFSAQKTPEAISHGHRGAVKVLSRTQNDVAPESTLYCRSHADN